jgi:hypothetical protein
VTPRKLFVGALLIGVLPWVAGCSPAVGKTTYVIRMVDGKQFVFPADACREFVRDGNPVVKCSTWSMGQWTEEFSAPAGHVKQILERR